MRYLPRACQIAERGFDGERVGGGLYVGIGAEVGDASAHFGHDLKEFTDGTPRRKWSSPRIAA
jgi:hypothetical protein